MKRSLLLLLLASIMAFRGLAQTRTVVYGHLGVENVNISVIGVPQGTVTDAQGNYTLMLTEKGRRINVKYSCIGYQDTVVGLTPRMLEKDSINVSFKLRKQE